MLLGERASHLARRGGVVTRGAGQTRLCSRSALTSLELFRMYLSSVIGLLTFALMNWVVKHSICRQ